MCDSIQLSFSVGHINTSNFPNCWPMEIKQTTNQDDEILSRHTSHVTAKSPLTDAEYQIHPKVEVVNDGHKVKAYVVSVNMPACTVKNNALLDILVFPVVCCTLRMLQLYLLKNGCPPEVVQRIQPDHATIQSLTFTYLLPAPKGKTADAMNGELELRARSLQASSRMCRGRGLSKVGTYEGTSRTVYVEHSGGIKVTAYVKHKPAPHQKTFCALPKKAAKEVFKESAKFLRVEAKLGAAWLSKHPEFAAIKNWKSRKNALAMQETVFDMLRALLGLDMQFRKRWPKPEYLQKLTPSQAEVLDAYKQAKKDTHLILDHPSLKGKSKQYVSKVKKALWDKLDIDIDIPWAEHARIPELKWFQYPGRYVLPKRLAHLAEYVFVRETVQCKLAQLRQLIAEFNRQSPNARRAVPQAFNAPVKLKVKAKRKLTLGNIRAGLK